MAVFLGGLALWFVLSSLDGFMALSKNERGLASAVALCFVAGAWHTHKQEKALGALQAQVNELRRRLG
jgi:hypothetical protein